MLSTPVRVFAGLSVLAMVLFGLFGVAPGISSAHVAAQRTLPPNQVDRGLVYDGLEIATSGPCVGMYQLQGTDRCTHGPDPVPPGMDIDRDVPPLPSAKEMQPASQSESVVCDGEAGYRVQVMYARAADQTDRFGLYEASIRQWAMHADGIFNESALETGGTRHIRYVLNGDCRLSVLNVVLSETGDDNFTNTKDELYALGYNRRDRKYMVFLDANVYCGIGSLYLDDQFGQRNRNNFGPSYGRTDTGCWGSQTPAHELMHNFGGVQSSAPHATAGHHCTDEYDRMCYDDRPEPAPVNQHYHR